MNRPTRHVAWFVSLLAAAVSASASADYGGADGYGHSAPSAIDGSQDGYVPDTPVEDPDELTNYVIIEPEDGTTEQVDGQTVIVVQEPEPVAVTAEAPPAPRAVAVAPSIVACPNGIWVDGYWGYANGQYVWVDGHCVVERVNYVFVQPRWDFYANVWWFVPGYYRPCGAYVGFGYYRPWQWYPPYYHSYYRTRYPVPVYRNGPYRRTTVQPAPARRRTYVAPAARPGRVTTTRIGSSPTRSATVIRRPTASPIRTGSVRSVRGSPSRTSTVVRTPGRSGVGPVAVGRPAVRPSASRTPPVVRASPTRTAPTRTAPTVRPSVTRTGPVVRPANGPTRTNAAPRGGSPPSAIVTQPRRISPARTGTVPRAATPSARSRGWTAPSGSSRIGTVGRPTAAPSRGSNFGRSGSSSWGGGRSRGFSGPSSRGFGGARSVPTARGR